MDVVFLTLGVFLGWLFTHIYSKKTSDELNRLIGVQTESINTLRHTIKTLWDKGDKKDEKLKKAFNESEMSIEKVETVRRNIRNPDIAKYVKKRANGICELCEQPAPFSIKNGPYLEVHHIKKLSDGGEDIPNNLVALCSNCHRKVHTVDDKNDIEKLLRKASLSI